MRLPSEKSVMMESFAVVNAGRSRELFLRRSSESLRAASRESASFRESEGLENVLSVRCLSSVSLTVCECMAMLHVSSIAAARYLSLLADIRKFC